jgi:DNA-binding NarL/FixJ family response regulator
MTPPQKTTRRSGARSQNLTGLLQASPIVKTGLKPPSRVLLIDNCRTFRDGIELAIARSKTLCVAGRAASSAEIFENGDAIAADIALVDIDLPDESGFEVCQRLYRANPQMGLVLLSYSNWDIFLLAAQTIHANGLLLRSQPTNDLITTLEKSTLGPIFTLEQTRRIQEWRSTVGAKLKTLRQREWQVLQLIAMGQSNREIAQQLSLTENTIEKHVSNLLQKLGLVSRAMMMVFIYTHHLDALSRMPHGDRFLMLLAN